MKYFFGPFIGEFGWELVYWHAWLRKIKKDYLKNDQLIVSSFPGRYPLYEFADEFIPLPNWYLKNRFSERGYFIDWEEFNLDKQKIIQNEMKKLINYYISYFENGNVSIVNEYPQKIYTQRLFYRIKNKLLKNISSAKIINKKNDIEKYLNTCNPYAGKPIQSPLFLNHPSLKSGDYLVQNPSIEDQFFIKLNPTSKGIKARDKILKDYKLGNRPIFTLFPRKRLTRRPDKNWSEESWLKFVSLLIDEFDPLIILCGSKNGAFLSNYKNDKNVINIINYPQELSLDLQLAFIKICKISIHGKSGSINLSLQSGCPTFLMGEEIERYYSTKKENPLNTSIYFYSEYGLNPPAKLFFKKFCEYYQQLNLKTN